MKSRAARAGVREGVAGGALAPSLFCVPRHVAYWILQVRKPRGRDVTRVIQ